MAASAGSVLDNGEVKGDACRRGAALRHLEYKGLKFEMGWPALATDRFARNAGATAEVQGMNDLEWRFERIAREKTRDLIEYSIVPSAFDGLRVRKTYSLAKDANVLTVAYAVTNLDDRAASFGHAFVFPVRLGKEGDVVTVEKDGALVETEVRTGMTKTFECVAATGRVFTAVRDRATGRGAVLEWPRRRTGAVVNWYSVVGTRAFTSIEYIGREEKVPPHGTLEFAFTIRFTDDVPAAIAALPKDAPPLGAKLHLQTRYETGGHHPPYCEVSASPVRFEEIFAFTVPAKFGGRTAVLDIGKDPPDGVAVVPRMKLAKDALEIDRPLKTTATRLADGGWRLTVALPAHPPAGDVDFELALVRGNGIGCVGDGLQIADCKLQKASTDIPHGTADCKLQKASADIPHGAYFVSYRKVPMERLLAQKLEKEYSMPLDLLETLADGTGLYHEPWFLPERDETMTLSGPAASSGAASSSGSEASSGVKIDSLFLFDPHDDMLTNGKRYPLELKARTGLDVRAMLLLREVTGRAQGLKQAFSVVPTFCAPRLSDWTMLRLRQLTEKTKAHPAQVVFVSGFDFKNASAEAVQIFLSWRAKGVRFFFVNCANIPGKLLGKSMDETVSAICATVPQLRKVDLWPFLQLYSDESGRPVAAATDWKASWTRCFSQYNPACPHELRDEFAPVYEGRDFPYFDYAYLVHAKALRLLAGVARPARFVMRQGRPAVVAEAAGAYTLETELKDLSRETLAKGSVALRLEAGENALAWRAPDLPGGKRVVHLRLKDSRGEVVDVCAYLDEKPEPYGLAVAVAKDIVNRGERARVTMKTAKDDPAATLAVWLEDTDRRVFRRTARALTREATFDFDLPAEPTRLYRVFAQIERDGALCARAKGEFAVRTAPLDLKDAHAYVTIPYAATEICPALAKLGFDFVISGFGGGSGSHLRQCAELGMASTPRNCADENSWSLPYRGDNPNSPTVRDPCFSDPKFHKTLEKRINGVDAAVHYDYYNVRLHWTGDEFFLGPNVCYSEHCLKRFRAQLAGTYGTVASLNAAWGTKFASFDEAVPCQLTELPSKDRLARWLDHKMFEVANFAAEWVGRPAELLRAAAPGSLCGPTGTQIPGYGYDWSQMMKYVTAIGYYDGCQRKYVHDFARLYGKDVLAGQCGGGYTHAHVDFEPYNYDTMWSGLLKGANLPYHYCGAAIDGDLSLTSNMVYWATSLREMKGGAAKLYLSASAEARVAVLYSQASMFAALAEGRKRDWDGAQTSWWRILSDLKVDFDFIPYEHLAAKGADAKYRVFVLPWAVSLSDAERRALAAFVARGGRLLADVKPGVRDGHGNRLADAAFASLFDGTRGRLFGEKFATYNAVALGGAGGESAESVGAGGAFAEKLRRDVGAALADAGVTAPLAVTDAKGGNCPCDACWRTDGPNAVVAVHVDAKGATSNGDSAKKSTAAGRFDFAGGEPVTVKLPRKGHVYDVRAGNYLGLTDTVKTTLVPAYTRLYSVLAEKPGDLVVTGPENVRAGGRATFSCQIANAVGPQVVHVEVTGPNGFAPWRFRKNFRTESGRVDYVFETAENDVPGSWRVTFTHVNTGKRVERHFAIR